MSITETTTRQVFAGEITGGTALAIIIPFFDKSDLVVELETSGATVTWTLGVDYNVTGGNGNGGTVTPVNTVDSGSNVVVYRQLPLTQPVDLENQGSLAPAAIELALDRLIMQLLDTDDSSTRSVKADDGEVNPTGLRMPDLATRASQLCGWDSLGEITAIDPTSVIPDSITVNAWAEAFVGAASALAGRALLRVSYGLNASKAASPLAGDLYFTTDTLEAYICKTNGSWLLLSASQETVIQPNLIINGSAQINQRVNCTSVSEFPNDDFAFCLDHVLLISDGSQVANVVQNTADVPPGASHCFEVAATNNNLKYGLLFPIDSGLASALISPAQDIKTSFRFKVKGTADVNAVKASLLKWTGAQDALIDPFTDGNWGIAGGTPSPLGAGWAHIGTTPVESVSTAWKTVELEDITLGANGVNYALAIWLDDTDAVASTTKIFIADVHVNVGSSLAPYRRPSFQQEWDACTRFMVKSFDLADEPKQNVGNTNGALTFICSSGTNDDDFGIAFRYPRPMFKTPTLTFYNPEGLNAQWRDAIGDTDEGANVVYNAGDSGFFARAENAAMASGTILSLHYTAIAEITA
jgi:hypothetical protein